MKNFICVFLLFFASHIYAQDIDSFYTIESYQDTYTPLDDYNSMVIETQASLSWTKRFELDFNFPFIDTAYNYINCKWTAVCWFDNSTNFSIYLMEYGYDYDIPDNYNNIQSDVRYAQIERKGQEALVLEFLKNRLITDTTVEEHDSYITFQQWFLEDGDMEIHFGDMNLEHSPVYVPGEGFYFITPNSEPLLFGPGIGLIHPNDDENEIGFLGGYDTFDIIDGIGVLRKIPPKGWVIKFNRIDTTFTQNQYTDVINIFPNPTHSSISYTTNSSIHKVVIYNSNGEYIRDVTEAAGEVSLHSLPGGMYFLKFFSDEGVTCRKVIKQ